MRKEEINSRCSKKRKWKGTPWEKRRRTTTTDRSKTRTPTVTKITLIGQVGITAICSNTTQKKHPVQATDTCSITLAQVAEITIQSRRWVKRVQMQEHLAEASTTILIIINLNTTNNKIILISDKWTTSKWTKKSPKQIVSMETKRTKTLKLAVSILSSNNFENNSLENV